MNVAHDDKTNADGYVIATGRNIEEYAAKEHNGMGRLVVYSLNGDGFYSATPADYFSVDPDVALVDGDGEPMVLAYLTPQRVEPITRQADSREVRFLVTYELPEDVTDPDDVASFIDGSRRELMEAGEIRPFTVAPL